MIGDKKLNERPGQRTRVVRKSHTQTAVDEIRRLILENELPAGSNHLESELSAKLGMSRTPIREATLILESQGLLTVTPRHGIRVRAISADDMLEIYQILTELEGISAEVAARSNLAENDLAVAEDAIRQMDDALARDDREAWARSDEIFHSELVRLGGNSRAAMITGMYNDQVRRIRALTLYLRPSPVQSNEDHRSVLAAIRAGNARSARSIHTRHRQRAAKLLIALLKKHHLV